MAYKPIPANGTPVQSTQASLEELWIRGLLFRVYFIIKMTTLNSHIFKPIYLFQYKTLKIDSRSLLPPITGSAILCCPPGSPQHICAIHGGHSLPGGLSRPQLSVASSSLGVRWLRLCLPTQVVQGVQVRSLVGQLRSHIPCGQKWNNL